MTSQPSRQPLAFSLALAASISCLLAIPSRADDVIADDLIVQGSAAIGLDAVNNESFGFNTLILKENNLRIFFNDTSTAAGFPANKWTLVANDTASGGANYFALEDTTAGAGHLSLRIDAGAPVDALRISGTGKLGLRTANPVLDIHVVTGNTPALRFEQDNSGGFTPQTWDVAGNEANFFVRDVTGGSRLPLRIRPGAPTSTLDLAASGFVGVGTASPAAKLHVALQASDVASNDGVLIASTSFTPVAAPVFTLHVEGTAFVSQTLEIGSSRERKENIKDLEIGEAEQALAGLNPVHFNYKSNTQHQLGFIAEEVPELVATESRKSLVPMDFVAVLTKVVQKHESRERELEKTLAAQQEMLKAMAARLDALERRNPGALTASVSRTATQMAARSRRSDHPEAAASSAPPKPVQVTPPAAPHEVLNDGR